MKIYLASRFSNRFMLREAEKGLLMGGHEVTSRWIHNEKRPENEEELRQFWIRWSKYDRDDMDDADAIIVCTFNCDDPNNPPRDGMRFEMGYIYAQKKPVIVVGPKVFVFDELDDIHVCENWCDCYALLDKL